MKGLSVLALQRSLYEPPDRWNGNKQQKDGLTLQKQTCQPMIKENWETREKKKNWTFYKKYVKFYFLLIKIWGDLGISIY